jgi:hypothetical protein
MKVTPLVWNCLFTAMSMSVVVVNTARSSEMMQTQSSVTEKTTTDGNPVIIQHVQSKMDPIAVQSREKTDPVTGEKEKVVEPLIMERHEKVLDTTIIQPETTETTKTTQQVTKSQSNPPVKVTNHTQTKSYTSAKAVPKRYKSIHHKRTASKLTASPVTKSEEIIQTTETTKQPIIKETIIQAPQANNSPPEPQVIQKTEVK